METPEPQQAKWFTVYYENSINAHSKKHELDYKSAQQLFEEALQRIDEQKKSGFTDKRQIWYESKLMYNILDCQIILQAPPFEIMTNLHKYGEYLEQMILDISKMHKQFNGLAGIFADDFSATKINDLQYAVDRFDDIFLAFDIKTASPELLEKIAMLYYYLSNYFHIAQEFFGFSTTMTEEGVQCVNLFTKTAQRTLEVFSALDDEYLESYRLIGDRDHANEWFETYIYIMKAKYELYIKDDVFASNWEFSETIDKLQATIENSLEKAENPKDEADKQTNQNKAEHAMELLMDVYLTYALMNVDNYKKAIEGHDKISEQAVRLMESRKVMFDNYLKRAIISRKYMLDMRYTEITFLNQLEKSPFFSRKKMELDNTEMASGQYGGAVSLSTDFTNTASYNFSQVATNEVDGLANRVVVPSIPDETEYHLNKVAEQINPKIRDENARKLREELKKNKKYMEWEKFFMDQLREYLNKAKMYVSENENENGDNHISKKWLAILEARLLLYEYFNFTEDEVGKNDENTKEKVNEVIENKDPSAKLTRIEEMLLKYAENPKGTYFRLIIEIYTLLGWIYIEKNDLDKANSYICDAYNIYVDLKDNSVTLKNELVRVHAKLKSKQQKDAENSSLEIDAEKRRREKWQRAFAEIIKKSETGDLFKNLTYEFQKIEPNIVDIKISGDFSGLTHGYFNKNDYAKGGMYKTVIKNPRNKDQGVVIQGELPIPEKIIESIAEYLPLIFNLREIGNFREQLKSTKDEKLKKSLQERILAKASHIVRKLMPENIRNRNKIMIDKFYKKLVDEKNLRLYPTIDDQIAEYIAILKDYDDEIVRAMIGDLIDDIIDNDSKMAELIDMIDISKKLTEYYLEEIGTENDPEEKFKIEQFLAEQIEKGQSRIFIEFVQDAFYHEDGLECIF